MKLLLTISSALVATTLAFNLHGQSVTTDPVGYVTFTVNANSDQRLGIPMQRPAVLAASASSVSQAVVQADGIESLSGAHFLLVTSGDAEGQWEEVVAASSGELTLAEAISGFTSGDRFAIRPFWTLDTLFPDGGAVPASSNPFNPVAFVLLNNPNSVGTNLSASSVFFYNDGTQGQAGWFNADGFAPSGGTIVSPEVSLVIRNRTGESVSPVVAGDVPVVPNLIDVVSRAAGRQDNVIYNPLPIPVSLSASDLISSGAFGASSNPFNPTDLLLLFDFGNTGINSAASSVFFYNDGTQGQAGWFNTDGFASADSIEIPPGGAFIIRKASGSDSSSSWVPPLLSF
jgi:uncharacterized protein (TIGR02597 family)